jgi:signal transduction histidine kinase
MDPISIIVIAIFGLIAAAALASGVYWLAKLVIATRATARLRSHGSTSMGGADDDDDDDEPGASRVSRLRARMRTFRSKARRARREFDDGDDDDDLPIEVTALLSATPLDSVIVDADGEVLRSSPAAYGLGVVDNDAIAEPHVADAVAKVFRGKGTQLLDIVTHTPVEFIDDDIARNSTDLGDADSSSAPDSADPSSDAADTSDNSAGNPADPSGSSANNADSADTGIDPQIGTVSRVSRRNWLKVTVSRLNATQAVVLVEDTSEERRFARIRDAFVSNVTQQLLKPTHALEQLGSELESERVDQESLNYYAKQVHYYSSSVNHLVSDLLLLLKAQEPITASASNRIDIKPLVERVIASFAVTAAERGISIVAQIPVGLTVNGQIDQLEGAVSKLIDNAVEYSPDNGTVGVAVSTTADGQGVVVRVVDHGIGISKKEQPHIFERFWRGSNQGNRSTEGTGLGLAIVKHVALTHHGSVSMWSAPGEGSTFSLTLPAASTDNDDAPQAAEKVGK